MSTSPAIFRSDDPAEENYIYSHLDFLQRGKGMHLRRHRDAIGGLAERGRSIRSPRGRRLMICFKAGPVETDTRPKGVFQAKSLGDLTQLIGMCDSWDTLAWDWSCPGGDDHRDVGSRPDQGARGAANLRFFRSAGLSAW